MIFVYALLAVLAVVNSVPNTFLIYWAPNVITLVAIFTFALWISPAPQKEYSAQSTSSAAPSANEFYVSIGKHVCLLLFTFGIWQLIWIYKTTKFTNLVTDEPARDPATKLLLCMFIPFYQIYWYYKNAKTTFVNIEGVGGVVLIDTGTGFVNAIPYIDTGSEWKQAMPYIDNGTGWVVAG